MIWNVKETELLFLFLKNWTLDNDCAKNRDRRGLLSWFLIQTNQERTYCLGSRSNRGKKWSIVLILDPNRVKRSFLLFTSSDFFELKQNHNLFRFNFWNETKNLIFLSILNISYFWNRYYNSKISVVLLQIFLFS